MELNLARDVKNTNKGFFRYIEIRDRQKSMYPSEKTKRKSWSPQTWRRLRYVTIYLPRCLLPVRLHVPLVSLNSRGALGEQNPSSVRAKQVLRPHHEDECIHAYGAG